MQVIFLFEMFMFVTNGYQNILSFGQFKAQQQELFI